MKELYKTSLYFTKLSPPQHCGTIPRIGRKKLLEKLNKDGVSEEVLEKSKNDKGYSVWLAQDLLLEITRVNNS